MPYIDIIIIALVAGFILLRLRSILGQDTGFDGGKDLGGAAKDVTPKEPAQKIFPLRPSDAVAAKDSEEASDQKLIDALPEHLQEQVAEIKKIEPSFDLEHFIGGAKSAFDMVLTAFNENDAETLKNLLADDIEEMFVAEAQARQEADVKVETTLVSIISAEVKDIELNKKHAAITLEIISEQVSVERDKDGAIIAGDAGQEQRVKDEWVYERDLGGRLPNWIITAT